MIQGPVFACGSCGSPDLPLVLDLGVQPTPQAKKGYENKRYPLRLVECMHCTLVQLDYIAPQDEVFPVDYPYTTGNTAALRAHFTSTARTIDAMLWHSDEIPDDSMPLVIDIGGNDGTFLKALQVEAPDAQLLLIEPTDQAKKCDDPRIEVVQEYFTAELAASIRESHGAASAIVASNVFGHIPDPHDFLNGVNILLARGGTFLIENQDWYNIVEDLQIDTIYHEHLRFYTPTSLSWLLSRHSLSMISWNRIQMHGGAFRAVVRKEKPDLHVRVSKVVNRLLTIMDEAKQAGPIYAVTAPTRATPLVNYAGLGKYLTCACEVPGSDKIGAFIPGTEVPIVDESVLFTDEPMMLFNGETAHGPPPHVLLLAWDIADGLIKNLRRKGYMGRIIIPLPEPRYADG